MSDDGADYVVVGAGSAGCVVAARLSERAGVGVVVLEAGGPDRPLTTRVPALGYRARATEIDWGYRTEPQAGLGDRPMYWMRGRGVGGTSMVNAQVWLRAHPTDFDGWPMGWGWTDVAPYYARAEGDTRPGGSGGRSGPVPVSTLRRLHPFTEAFLDAATERGLRRNDDLLTGLQGAGPTPVTLRRGRRWNAADAYLAPAAERPNLRLITGARATRVVFDGSRARGVEYIRDGARHVAWAGEGVVVCAGTVASPQLLLLSGVGPAEQLRAHGIPVIAAVDGVGQNLRDHVGLGLRFRTSRRPSLVSAESPLSAVRYALGRRGPLSSNVVEACLFTESAAGKAPALELAFAPLLGSPAVLYRGARRWLARQMRPRHGCSIFANLQQVQSVGWLELASSDPLAPPRIQPACLSDPDAADLAALVDSVREVRALAASPALSRWIEGEQTPGPDVASDDEVRAFVRRSAHTADHAVGTCRMGTDELAVVDPALRVHGTTNLHVADASVMPTTPTGHPYATVMMLGERAAELVVMSGT